MGQQRQPITPGEPFDVQPLLAACGRVVRAARKSQGLSQAALAALVGTVHSSLTALENGTQFPRVSILLHILHKLGLSAAVALPQNPDDPRLRLVERVATASPEKQALVEQFMNILENAHHRSSRSS